MGSRAAWGAILLLGLVGRAGANDTWVGLQANGTADLDHATGVLHHVWPTTTYSPTFPAFSPNGTVVFMSEPNFNTTPPSGRIGIYDRNHNALCGALPPCPSAAWPLGIASTGSRTYWGDILDDKLHYINNTSPFGGAGTVDLDYQQATQCQGVAGVAASPSGSEIWAACLNDLRVVNTTTLSVTHVITDHAQGLYQVALLDFGASYVVASMAYASPAQPGGYAVIGAHTYSIVSTSNVGDLRGVSCLTNGDDCFVAGQGTNQLYWIHNGSLYDQFSASTFGNCQTPFGAAAFFTTTMGGENFLDVSCKGNDGVARYGIPTGMNWYSSCQPHGYSCVYQGTTSVRTPLGIRIVH